MKSMMVLMVVVGLGVPVALWGKLDMAVYKATTMCIKEAVKKGKDRVVDADRLSYVGGLTAKELEKEKNAFTVDEKEWLSSFATRADSLNVGALAAELTLIGNPFFGIWWLLTDMQLAAIISFIEFKVLSYGRRFEPSTLEQLQKKATELRVKLDQR